jgi:hypothetical protein
MRMRTILLATLVAMLPLASIATAQTGGQKPDKPSSSDKLLPLKGSHASDACAAYGPGFTKVDGSDTCVKVGGAVSIGVSSSSGAR